RPGKYSSSNSSKRPSSLLSTLLSVQNRRPYSRYLSVSAACSSSVRTRESRMSFSSRTTAAMSKLAAEAPLLLSCLTDFAFFPRPLVGACALLPAAEFPASAHERPQTAPTHGRR